MNYKSTIDYYDNHAEAYCQYSLKTDLSNLYLEFERYLAKGASILDVGCGSGRDSKYFSERGYHVTAIDTSREMCRVARKIPGIDVRNMAIQELNDVEKYDGIWACASLLHLSEYDLNPVIEILVTALRRGAILYASWKTGEGERYDEYGRYFFDCTEERISNLFSNCADVEILKCWTTCDTMSRLNQEWTNIIVRKTLDYRI